MRYSMCGVRCLVLALVLPSAFFVMSCGPRPSAPPVGANLDPKVVADELATLAGAWVYERQVVEGGEVPLAELKGTIVISGNSLVRNVTRADGQQVMPIKSALSVDPTASPKQMDDEISVALRTNRRLGIYKLEGDQLTLCYDNSGKQRPTSFDSPAGSSFVLTVLRRRGR